MPPISSKYIENAFQKGYNEEQIKSSLRAQGISEADIVSAFGEYNKQQNAIQTAQPLQPQQFTPSVSASSRIQHQTGFRNSWIIGTIVVLILLGAGAASYYYFDDLKNILGGIVSDFSGGIKESLDTWDEVEAPAVESPAASVPSEPEVLSEVSAPQNIDDAKISAIDGLKMFADAYFTQNGVYPQTVSNSDPDVFYCYRKNGGHYILGTTLEAGNSALSADLDGSYYCGDKVKECADPVYCVAP